MRPNSRGNLGPSTGVPPGTSGIRPGSGRKPPGTGRLRTGAPSSGTGTEAAQGYALNAAVNVSERPMTGQGVMGMKAQSGNTGRIVMDAAYFIGILRKKISDTSTETNKLRVEIEQQSKDSTQYTTLERKYETLLKNKEQLEGQLADYNLALDKTRTSTDPEDVQQMASHMADKNRQSGQDLDRVFMQRKQREQEIQQIEEQIEAHYRQIQKRINELEPGKLRAYNDLLAKQRELQDRTLYSENRLNEINSRIRHYESDDKANTLRKDYLALEKQCATLKKEVDSLQEDLDTASSADSKAAKESFKSRAEEYKKGTKNLEEKASQLREEISAAKRNLEELSTVNEEDSGEAAKYELLVKRDQDMTAFMDGFDEARGNILRESQGVQYMIVALLESIGKGLEDSTNMPTQEGRDEMDRAKSFKERNLATAQKTMESLLAEKRKREREMEMLRSSEPNLMNELRTMRESMSRMRSDMEDFKDLDRIRREFDHTQSKLQDMKQIYIKRRDTMRQQIQSISIEHESVKKALSANETAREMEDTEKRVKHYERSIFELKEFVDAKSRETDYEQVKMTVLRLTETLNSAAIKKCQEFGSIGNGGAQAKGGW